MKDHEVMHALFLGKKAKQETGRAYDEARAKYGIHATQTKEAWAAYAAARDKFHEDYNAHYGLGK